MTRLLFLVAVLAGLVVTLAAEAHFDMPPLPPREEYGNILINRTSTQHGRKPVGFSHWLHRKKYTCRVCHNELEFNMKVNTTEITELANRAGKYCGACHNGKIAFKANGNCDKCHSGDIGYGREKFNEFYERPYPNTMFGDGINWVEAQRQGLITPSTYLKKKTQDIPFDKFLLLESEWSIIAPSIFPHKAHTEWLDCENCHPEIFNIKKKGTKHFTMSAMLNGQFCGVCHLSVAFPLDDCKRCHPGLKEGI